MNERFDKLIEKLAEVADKWVEELQENPIRTALKILVILWVVKQGRKLLREVCR
jgi:hypothetical protein